METKSALDNSQISLLQDSTIENFLLELGYPKSWIKKHLSKKELSKNIKGHQTIDVPFDLLNRNLISPIYSGPPCDIIFENEGFLVLNKPSNVHGHALTYTDQQNILSFIRSQDKGKLLNINTEKYERGLLYRLDYETSGVLIYVKNQNLFDDLFENRETKVVEKKYRALVHGKTAQEEKIIDHLKGSDKKGSHVIVDPNGEQAELSYQTLEYNSEKNLSLIEVKLKTGLRHQIRVQMAHAGHPLLGDVKYGGESADRLFLHAFEYSLDLSDGIKTFQAPTPFSFVELLGQCARSKCD